VIALAKNAMEVQITVSVAFFITTGSQVTILVPFVILLAGIAWVQQVMTASIVKMEHLDSLQVISALQHVLLP